MLSGNKGELDVINVNLRDILKHHISSSNVNTFPILHVVTGQITLHLYANLIDKLARILPNMSIILCNYTY